MKELEIRLQYNFETLQISGHDNSIANPLSHYTLQVSAQDPHPDRQSGPNFWNAVAARCGKMDADMLAHDDGSNASCDSFRSPSNSAFDRLLQARRLWWFPRIDMMELGLSTGSPGRGEKAYPA